MTNAGVDIETKKSGQPVTAPWNGTVIKVGRCYGSDFIELEGYGRKMVFMHVKALVDEGEPVRYAQVIAKVDFPKRMHVKSS